MSDYYRLIKLLARRILVILLAYQICRLLFFFFNMASFPDVPATAWTGGILFDLSAIGVINIIFVLLHLIPGNFKYSNGYQNGLKTGFFAVNILFLATNFVDFEYYKFTGRRSSFALITARGMEHEISGLILSFVREFWYLPFGFALLAIIIWKLLSRVKFMLAHERLTSKMILKQSLILLLSIGIVLLMIRGGFGRKPLRIVDAINYSTLGNAAVVLNTPFSIIKTLGKHDALKDPKFYSKKELGRIFDPVQHFNPGKKSIRKNVVIIILESFGDENLRLGYTPFLDSLITRSLYFKNGFANGKVSIDAVPSIFSSVPSLMNNSLISSGYALNEVYGLPKIFKNQGYKTSFFHGAFNGSQNFDQYCKVAGFESYYGKNEYPGKNPADFDGRWGIFDEEFLGFFCDKLTSFRQPFFSAVFTISSHNPFIMPARYQGKFKVGTTKNHATIGYSDFALRKFFAQASHQSWYKNTVFVITADHTDPYGALKYQNNVTRFKIPILFFDPSNHELQRISEKNFQQIDILPSLLDYLNITDNVVSFGKSFLSDQDFVVTYLDNTYNYISGDFYMAFDGTKAIGLYDFKKDPALSRNLVDSEKGRTLKMERFIKAYIQSFNERLIDNSLILKPDPKK